MDGANTIQATGTSFRVLEALAERDGAGVSELARHLDHSRSGIHKHLATLAELGYVTQTGDTYRLNHRVFSLGTAVRESDPLFDASREPVVELSSVMNERVCLYGRRDEWLTCLFCTADRNRPDRRIPEGSRRPVSECFVGAVVLAQENGGDAPAGSRGIDERRSIRGHQIGVETEREVRRIAMPILDDGAVVGALVVSGSAGRLEGRRVGEDVPGLMVSTIENIESAYADAVREE